MDERELARWTEHERKHGYIRARLRLLETEEGGRRGPIYSGYRSCWGFPPDLHRDMHDGPLVIEEAERLDPGSQATVRLHPLIPELWPTVAPGLHLGMFEGSRRVGEATVIEVVAPAGD